MPANDRGQYPRVYQLWLSEEMYQALRRLAFESNTPVSQIIRAAIDAELTKRTRVKE